MHALFDIAGAGLHRPLARVGNALRTGAELACDAKALAARLPAAEFVLNHCEDRYAFMVGFIAALLRRQVTLFPPNRAPEVLARLALTYPKTYLLTDGEEQVPGMACVRLKPLDNAAVSPEVPALHFSPAQPALIAFTSGSTGVPVAHAKTVGMLIEEAHAAAQAFELDAQAGGAIVATVPAQHMYGLLTSVLWPVARHLLVDSARPFYPEDVRAALARQRSPAILVTTPVHIRALVLDGARLPQLAFILSSTAPLHAELAAQAEALFGVPVWEIYGSTETGAIARRRQTQNPAWRPFAGVVATAHEQGFEVTAPYLPAAVRLGDEIENQADGGFVLRGRHTDLIKIAGKRMSLADLNRILLSLDGVLDGAFFCPDTAPGQELRLMAFVVAPGRTREELVAALKDRIDPVFMPRPLRILEGLPRNANGKLPRAELKALAQQIGANP